MTEKTAKELLAAIRELTEALKVHGGGHVHHHHAPQPLFQPGPAQPDFSRPWATTGGVGSVSGSVSVGVPNTPYTHTL